MKNKVIITGDGSPTVHDWRTGANFHSLYGARAESEHVFIQSGLLYASEIFGNNLLVLEAGFGTGLNATLTLIEARRRNLEIHYTGVEKYPLENDVLDAYISVLENSIAIPFKALHAAPWQKKAVIDGFQLEKVMADLNEWRSHEQFNVVYFDAFAPGVAPDLWTERMFCRIAGMMVTGAALVTFCAQGEMRRRLKRAGFLVQKLPGAPGKREMTRAIKL